jgi:RNA polymerase sigma-70 factor, ECF subfamily
VTAQQRFESLYGQHADAVHRYALRRMHPREAEDIVAEVFLTAWRRLEDVPAHPRGWLLGVARRVASNTRRGCDRRAALRARLEAENEWTAAQPQGEIRLTEALLTLSELDREALTMIAWDGLSHREAAQALGVKEGTFAVRLYRAKRRLARALDDSPAQIHTQTQLEAR